MNLIRVAGHVVNMDYVLYIEYGKQQNGTDFVTFNFPGSVHTVTDNNANDNTTWNVTGAEASMFILWLEKHAENVIPQEPGATTPKPFRTIG